jgi:O-antigen ligase
MKLQAWTRSLKSFLEDRSNWPVLGLQAYLFFLAWRTKGFAYLHIDIGPLPLYVGEVALASMLMWTLLRRRNELFAQLKSVFGISLIAFLSFGFVRLVVSLLVEKPETGTIQVLRDSALVYQALWVAVGLSLTRLEIRRAMISTLAGAVFAQGEHWIRFLISGRTEHWMFLDLWSPPGNEIISPLVGLAFVLLPTAVASVMYGFSSLTLLGIFTVYLKRSWLLAAFMFAVPLQMFGSESRAPGGIRRFLLSRLIPSVLALAVGLGLSVLSEVIVLKRLGKDPSILFSMWAHTHMDVQAWVFHNEKGNVEEKDGTVTYSYMRWRAHLWRQAWYGFTDRPWIGHGFGPRVVTTLVDGKPAIYAERWISGPHNSYLTLLFRVGALGAIPLVVMLLAMAFWGIRSWALARFRLGFPETVSAIFLSAAAYAVFNVGLENPHNGNWFWIFLGAWFAMSRSRAMPASPQHGSD